MSQLSANAPNIAKKCTEASFGNRRRSLRLNSIVMQKSRDLFSVKTALHLSELTGYSVRSCEAWLSESVVLPSDALAALIQSDWGREYLACVMTDTTPRWWLTLKALIKRISFEAAEARQDRQYRELLNEEAEARKYQVAPSFQDDPFFEGQPSPARSVVSRRRVKGGA